MSGLITNSNLANSLPQPKKIGRRKFLKQLTGFGTKALGVGAIATGTPWTRKALNRMSSGNIKFSEPQHILGTTSNAIQTAAGALLLFLPEIPAEDKEAQKLYKNLEENFQNLKIVLS